MKILPGQGKNVHLLFIFLPTTVPSGHVLVSAKQASLTGTAVSSNKIKNPQQDYTQTMEFINHSVRFGKQTTYVSPLNKFITL